MPIKVERVPDAPILVVTAIPPLHPTEDPRTANQESNAFAEEHEGTAYRIVDFTAVDLTFQQVMGGLAEDVKHAAPNLILISVGSGDLVKLGVEAAKQEQYGEREMYFFESVEEAIAFCRSHHAD